jgi:transcriptional regulator with XRE-family HTH domain
MKNTTSTIKKIRKRKGMTLDYLAQITGLTKGYLSKVERADTLPPFSTLELIAKAFDIEVTLLIEKSSNISTHPDVDIMLKEKREKNNVFQSCNHCSFTSLLHSYKGRYMTPILVTLEPKGEREFKHDGEEFVYVLSGKLTLLYENETFDLKTGDCFYLDSRKEHRFKNNKNTQSVLLSVSFNYRRF